MASVVRAKGTERIIIQLGTSEAVMLRRLLLLAHKTLLDGIELKDVVPKWRKRLSLGAILTKQLKEVTGGRSKKA